MIDLNILSEIKHFLHIITKQFILYLQKLHVIFIFMLE